MLFSQICILNGLFNTNSKSFIIFISPPSIIGATKIANHITGIIPITNIIAVPQENCVVKEDYSLGTPIVTAKDLPYYIKNKINKTANYSPLLIKESLLENKIWTFDIFISKLQSFLKHSKIILLFLAVFLGIYYVYITLISYIFFKLITL